MSKTDFVFEGETIESTCEQTTDLYRVTVGEKMFELRPAGKNLYWVNVEGQKRLVAVARDREKYYIDIDSVLLEVSEPSDDGFAGGGGDAAAVRDKIFAPMPGKIVKIMVAVGDEVKVKQPMVIVEAMKMENQVNSRADGRVKAVNFAAGDQVDTETPIIELELEKEE